MNSTPSRTLSNLAFVMRPTANVLLSTRPSSNVTHHVERHRHFQQRTNRNEIYTNKRQYLHTNLMGTPMPTTNRRRNTWTICMCSSSSSSSSSSPTTRTPTAPTNAGCDSEKQQQQQQQTNKVRAKLSSTAKLTLLYDGDCPLCMREVNMLRGRSSSDAYADALDFVDIAGDDFDDDAYGVDYETAMGRIHGVLADGSVVAGVDVFRRAYDAVGLGWVYAVVRVPLVAAVAERVYDVWAERRLQLTGRDTLEAIMRARNEKRSCR